MAKLQSLERLREVYDYNPLTGLLRWKVVTRKGFLIGSLTGYKTFTRYGQPMAIATTFEKTRYLAHRLAWFLTHGQWPAELIDHINGNPFDNRLSNLREASHSQNMRNRRKPNIRNTSGYLGVSKHGSNWKFAITENGSVHTKSGFKTPEEAYSAYVAAKRFYHSDSCTI